jgi:prolyl oligopeptidase
MKIPFASVCLLGATLTAPAIAGASTPAVPSHPPATRVDPVAGEIHGVRVVDPYRWLEGDDSDPQHMGRVTPEVAKWTDEQNAYTRSVLDHLAGREQLENRLRPLLEIGSVSRPTIRGERFFFARREGTQNQPVYYYRDGARGPDEVLVDPAKLDATGLTTVTWISPSQDGRQVAYGTYRAGDENTMLHLMDVDSGQVLGLEIPDRVEPPDWLPDGSGFVYQNLKDPKDPYSGQVLFHKTGTDPAADPVLFRQYTKEENEKLATTWGPQGSLSRDGRWLILGYWTSTRSNDLWIADFHRYLETGKLERRELSVGGDGTIQGTVVGGTLFLDSNQGAPNGRIFAVDPAQPQRENWKEIVPERADEVIEAVDYGKGYVAVQYLKDATSVIEVFRTDGTSVGRVKLPGLGTAAISAEPDRTDAYVDFTSFNFPHSIFRVDLAKPGAEPELWERPDVPVDPSTIEVEQVWYPSRDGTKISMFVVHRKGLQPDGHRPTLLTGYGGFNISMTPSFQATLFPWLEDGGVYALPNLRGGGEYGDAWHEAGMLERKQNVFDDFAAAGEWLITHGYTDRAHLACAGGSNGGLLTGVMVTQHPDLFRAAIVAVPLLDMLRYQDFLMARYWVPEYGSAENADQFRALYAYSPYQHVEKGVKYPAVLLTGGENDSRVHALHARKMAALLQASTASDPAKRPVLLWVDREAGHGQGKPLNLRLRDLVDQRVFLRWQLGMLPNAEAPAEPKAKTGR